MKRHVIKKGLMLFSIMVLMLGSLSACGKKEFTPDTASESSVYDGKYFITIKEYGNYALVYDKETKVIYCMSAGNYNRGTVSPLYNDDGTLKLYETE